MLWNFVCACPKCNKSKNNKLAPDAYLTKPEIRNGQIPFSSLSIDYHKEYLEKMYEKALFNGFGVWTLKTVQEYLGS